MRSVGSYYPCVEAVYDKGVPDGKTLVFYPGGSEKEVLNYRKGKLHGSVLSYYPNGDLQSKVDPYLRPLYDALYQIMGADSFQKNMEKGLIEVAPLAYMRGRTLDNAYIILDEAQNTTPAQMKMFLTRIGFGSIVVVTGDASQKDLAPGSVSGLDVAVKVLSGIEDIAFCSLTSRDVVRHPLVQKIVSAYETYEARQARSQARRTQRLPLRSGSKRSDYRRGDHTQLQQGIPRD